jgi:serine/threonine-protein phosphatase 2B catalytic subunit
MIRAHEVQDQGYSFTYWEDQTHFPSIITLFSAPNYCGGANKGAIASIEVNIFKMIEKRYKHISERKAA